MGGLAHVPPGRAGRLWLQHRLATAERGATLLETKLRILHAERLRLALLIERTRTDWESAARDADTWLLRAGLLGGERAIRLAASGTSADVAVSWTQSMGVSYPAEAQCTVTGPDAAAPPPANAALAVARDRYRQAVEAAVRHAVAEGAARVVEEEERATRRRLRALEERRVPQLRGALAEVLLGLEEAEHGEGVRLRWVAARAGGGGASSAPRTDTAGSRGDPS